MGNFNEETFGKPNDTPGRLTRGAYASETVRLRTDPQARRGVDQNGPLGNLGRRRELETKSYVREKIASIALAEAAPQAGTYGKVSDHDTILDPRENRLIRRGWARLQQYYDGALTTKLDWSIAQNREGIRVPGQRIPGTHWCGIFAVWVLQQAGIKATFTLGVGPLGVTKVAGNKGIQVGDICVVRSGIHHFIVAGFCDEQRKTILSVDGNAAKVSLDDQNVLTFRSHRVEDVWYYYSSV